MIDDVIAEVRSKVADVVCEDMPIGATCLYHAVFAVEAIRARGVRAILQAGSTSWRCVPDHLDDGVAPNAFSYMWDPEAARHVFEAGGMPEMHVWAATPRPLAIVDLTTGYFPDQAQRLLGLPWTAPRPPPFVWGEPPPGCRYEPHEAAVRVALMLAVQVIGVDRVRRLVD